LKGSQGPKKEEKIKKSGVSSPRKQKIYFLNHEFEHHGEIIELYLNVKCTQCQYKIDTVKGYYHNSRQNKNFHRNCFPKAYTSSAENKEEVKNISDEETRGLNESVDNDGS